MRARMANWSQVARAALIGLALLLAPRSALGNDLNPYGASRAANPPLALGSAADPAETPASASPTAQEQYPPADAPTGQPLPASAKRPKPDYGGPQDSGSGVLWVPRVLFAPLYVVSEFVIRRPIGAIISFAEEHYWPQTFLDITSFGTYGSAHPLGLLPTAYFDWGVRANAGLYFFADNALADGNEIRVTGSAGGANWLHLQLADRLSVGSQGQVALVGSITRRADQQFWGLGPESAENDGAYYRRTLSDARLAYRAQPWRTSTFESEAGLRSSQFDNRVSENPSLAEAIARGLLSANPPGFEGYALTFQRLAAAVDTRKPRHAPASETASDFVSPPGTGVRLELHGEHDIALSGLNDSGPGPVHHWVRYGGGLGVFVDLTGTQRTLGLSVSTELADPLRHTEMPFTELPSLGGAEPMRGFRPYRLIDRSYLAAKTSYRWPISSSLDGLIDAALGNVFGKHYEGLQARRLRGSFAMGIETTGSRDLAFQVLLAVGTRTIEDGFGVESVRFTAGTSSEF